MSLSINEKNKLDDIFSQDYSFTDVKQEPLNDNSSPYTRPSSSMSNFSSPAGTLEGDIEELLGMVGMPSEKQRSSSAATLTSSDFKAEISGLKQETMKDSVAEWLNDAATSLSRASNYSPGSTMFSNANTPSPSINGGSWDIDMSPYASPLNSASPYSNRKNSMPLMPRPAAGGSLFPSPENSNHMQFFPSNGQYATSATPPLISRSQSCSPIMRPNHFSPANALYSPFIPSPMSRCGTAAYASGQIDYSQSPGGGHVVHRRNLGVRTRAITPGMAKEGAKKKSKIMKEENASCMTCYKEIATLILHGSEEAVYTNYQVAMNCADCEAKHDTAAEDIYRRKQNVDCDCCRRKVAVGGAKVQSLNDPNKWVDPSFGVEVVCVSCRDKYGFCTECGGGNRFRTGKWRPLELFEDNRRTCKFSHTRIGKTPVRYQTFHVSTDFSRENYKCVHGYGCSGCSFDSVLKELKDMYFDRKLFAYAVPVIMETCPSTMTWEKLNKKIMEHWMVVENYLVTPVPSTKRRYLDLAFITPPVPRRKGKSSKEMACGPSTDQMIGGFVCGEWDMTLSTFVIAQRCNRGVGGDPCSMVLEMSKNLVSRAVKDSSALTTGFGSPLPLHVHTSGFTRFHVASTLEFQMTGDRDVLKADMEYTVSDFSYGRLGFVPATEYVKKFSVGEEVESALLPKSGDDTVFAVNLRDLMATSLGTNPVGSSDDVVDSDSSKRQKL